MIGEDRDRRALLDPERPLDLCQQLRRQPGLPAIAARAAPPTVSEALVRTLDGFVEIKCGHSAG